jgi:hypothetical protein
MTTTTMTTPKRTHAETMLLVDEILQPDEDDSYWEELTERRKLQDADAAMWARLSTVLTPDSVTSPSKRAVDLSKPTAKKKIKSELARSRRSKRLSPRRQMRPIRYSI